MIEAHGLTKRYSDVQALDGLTFGVQQGTIFGLLGPNGAGKSTAVKVLTTLARADGGSACVAVVATVAGVDRCDGRRAVTLLFPRDEEQGHPSCAPLSRGASDTPSRSDTDNRKRGLRHSRLVRIACISRAAAALYQVRAATTSKELVPQ